MVYVNQRSATDKISRLEQRRDYLKMSKTHDHAVAEVAALEWAIPILKEYAEHVYGGLLPMRKLTSIERAIMMKKLMKERGPRCYLCGKLTDKTNRTIDHVIPLAKGGSETEDNLAIAHEACNTRKANLMLDEYLNQEKERLHDETERVRPRDERSGETFLDTEPNFASPGIGG